MTGDSDGVVAVSSARVPYSVSEVTVPADHSNVHNHPLAVLEVQRILREHVRELRAASIPGVAAPAAQAPAWTAAFWPSGGPSSSIYPSSRPTFAPPD